MQQYSSRHKNWLTAGLLVFVVTLGLVLRLHNVSDYKFYPDSYQNLLVAHNLSASGSEVGPLGPEGMNYPLFIDWTRPAYAWLIMLVDKLISPTELAAQTVTSIASLLAIPAAFALLWRITGRRLPAILAALLVAVSFNHVVWSGFVMTEALSVLVALLFLERLVYISRLENFRLRSSVTAGWLFGVCLLTRYEYILLIVPAYLLLRLYGTGWQRKYWMMVLTTLFIVVGWFAIYPMHFGMSVLVERFLTLTLSVLFALGLAQLYARHRNSHRSRAVRKWLLGRRRATVLPPMAVGIASLAIAVGLIGPRGLRQFIVNDFVLYTTSVAGLLYVWRQKAYRRWAVVAVAGIVLLAFAYLRINPNSGRYWTHLLPLLIIPAALLLESITRRTATLRPRWKMVTIVSIALAFGVQAAISYRGMHSWDGGIWFKPGYEEVSARRLDGLIKPDDILLVSFPEPYFYFTGNSSHTLRYGRPSIPRGERLNNRNVVIVDDMGMKRAFPDFHDFLRKHMQPYKTGSYKVGADFRYQRDIRPENQPVDVYVVKVSKLWSLLEDHP